MSQTAEFIRRLEELKEGERSRLRRLAGKPLDGTLAGFDLFTGLWWPLREKSQAAPRRETSWLVAKLHAAFSIPLARPETEPRPTLPRALAHCEPPDDYGGKRFRQRFDALLQTPLPALEPQLQWALYEVGKAIAGRVPWARTVTSLDWVELLDDVSIWDRREEHRRGRDIRDIWAEDYLNAVRQPERS